MARLEELGQVITGNTPKTSEIENYSSEDICFVKPSDILENDITYINDSEFYISEAARDKARVLPTQSVLVTCIGIIGKVAINQTECAFNQQINAIIPDARKCKSNYLAYAILHKKGVMQNIANAAVVPILNKTQFSEIEINLPSLDEQQRIATILDKVSDLISLRKQQLAKLDELVKARFVEMFGDPVQNAFAWPVWHVKELVSEGKNTMKAGPFGSSLKKEFYTETGYKIYGQEQVISGDITYGNYYISEEKYKELESCSVQAGDILISLVGTYGKTLVIPENFEPGIINPRLIKITLDQSKLNVVYFQHFFASDSLVKKLENAIHGCTMGVLNLGIIKEIEVPLPPIELQNEFSILVAKTDEFKLTIQQSLDKLEVLKKSLMQEYFGG